MKKIIKLYISIAIYEYDKLIIDRIVKNRIKIKKLENELHEYLFLYGEKIIKSYSCERIELEISILDFINKIMWNFVL